MKTSTLLDAASRQNILQFLDSKQKDAGQDPDKRWITTWNPLPKYNQSSDAPSTADGRYL
jgi:hypothetical protein